MRDRGDRAQSFWRARARRATFCECAKKILQRPPTATPAAHASTDCAASVLQVGEAQLTVVVEGRMVVEVGQIVVGCG